MDVSSKSWCSDHESDDDKFVDIQREELNSASHQLLPADGEAATSSQRRTENLVSDEVTQKLIHLSALVPGPNEIDEVTVISKTVRYVKELQETVNLLEDRMGMEQPVSANKRIKVVLSTDDEASSEDTASSHRADRVSGYNHEIDSSDYSLPDIEARFMNKEVFVRIQCRKSKGLLSNVHNHLENLHLSPTHNNVLHFGSSHLYISIVAQMEEGFTMTVEELVASLRMAFSPSI